jgi:outer membrane protein assembly factor BamB
LAVFLAVTALWPVPARATVGVAPAADATWGTEIADTGKAGRVLTVVVSGGLVYLGGDFAALSPPGSKDTAALVRRDHLAALADGGTTLAEWNPAADGEVRALLPAADGSRIYAGGMFKHIGGQPASRLAALDPTTGALDPTFVPPTVDGVVRVLALSPDGKVLYVGGDFSALTAADGTVENRPHLAALDAATGGLIPWLPPDDTGGRYSGHTGTKDRTRPGGVYAIAPSADGTTVHVGGTFLSFGGHSGLVSLDAATGQPTPWQTEVDRPVFGLTRGSDGHTFYAAAGGEGGRLIAFRPHGPPEGVWQVKTDGDNLAVVETAATVYLIGHYDNIVQPDSDCYQYCPDGQARGHLSAFDRNGVLEDWNPIANTPTGPYAAAADGTHLYVVGEFTKIGGIRHVGFASFSGAP